MTTIYNTKLGETKGLKRVWLQGKKLSDASINPGDRINVEKTEDGLLLRVGEEGKYTVSRKKHYSGEYMPVIDLTAKELAEQFDGVEKLRTDIRDGTIRITAHHQHQKRIEREKKFLDKIRSGEALDVVSLFHGGGLLDYALHEGYKRYGIKTRLAVASEIEQKYLDCSRRNNPVWDDRTIAIEGPIQDMDLRNLNWSASMLVAGIPCVGASKSGRVKNALEYAESHEAAGTMFFSTLEAVKAFNPGVVWFEQVPEYLSTASWVVVKSVMESLGYDLELRILDSFEMGALEQRKRMCCVATSKGLKSGFDISNVTPIRTREAKIEDILEHVDDNDPVWKTYTGLADKECRDKASKKGFRRQLITPDDIRCKSIGKGYQRARGTEPFLVNSNDPSRSRLLTRKEHAAVKTVPEWLTAGESKTIAHEIMGQGVVQCAFEAVAASHGQALMEAFVTAEPTEMRACAA